MKNINTVNTSGSEAVIISVVTIWFRENDLKPYVERFVDQVGDYSNFNDYQVGIKILQHQSLLKDFMDWIADRPDLRKVLNLGLQQYKLDEYQFNSMIRTDIGKLAINTKWWKDNIERMAQARKNLKIVQKVQESLWVK